MPLLAKAAATVSEISGSSDGSSRGAHSTMSTATPRSVNAVAISSAIPPPPTISRRRGGCVELEQLLVGHQPPLVESVDRLDRRSRTGTDHDVLGTDIQRAAVRRPHGHHVWVA